MGADCTTDGYPRDPQARAEDERKYGALQIKHSTRILLGGLRHESVTHNEDLPPLAHRGLLCEDDGTESL